MTTCWPFGGCWSKKPQVDELCVTPALELARAVRAHELSAEEVCTAFLTRAVACDAATNCFAEIDAEAALVAARELDGRRELGALAGVPYGAKDVFVWDGRLPGAGTARMGLTLRAGIATAHHRLQGSDAICLGRLNLDPWAYAATGANADRGDTRNPWNPGRLSGGSSGGAAAAVAARAVPFALAGDTGGSIRIPAALCGVLGLKPTFGRISRRGSLPLSYSQDVIGAIAASASDLALLLEVVEGYDPLDPASIDAPTDGYLSAVERAVGGVKRPLSGTRIGVDPRWLEDRCEQSVLDLARRALAVFSDLGAAVIELDLSALPDYDLAASVLTQAESASVHRTGVRDRPEDYAASTRMRVHAGLLCQGSDHVDALRYQGLALRELLDGPLALADVLAVPVAPSTAPAVAELAGRDDSGAVAFSLELLSLNRPFSFVGVPALSLPVGFAGDGLPTGLQLVTRPWREQLLLTTAAAYQAATDWHRCVPELPLHNTAR